LDNALEITLLGNFSRWELSGWVYVLELDLELTCIH
jgi:hypothetical protein